MLSKLEETLVVGENRYELSCNQYPGAIHPQRYVYLHEFRLNPFPTFVYRVENLELEKTLCMVHGQNTIVTEYCVRHTAGEGLFDAGSLEVRPLLAFRDYHSLTHRNTVLDPFVAAFPWPRDRYAV